MLIFETMHGWSMLEYVAVCCSVVKCVAECKYSLCAKHICMLYIYIYIYLYMLIFETMHGCSMLQCVVVCCGVVQCVTECM